MTPSRRAAILTANRGLLEQAAEELVAKATFTADDLSAIARKLAPTSPPDPKRKAGVSLAAVDPVGDEP